MLSRRCLRTGCAAVPRLSSRGLSVGRSGQGSSRILNDLNFEEELEEGGTSKKLLNRFKHLCAWKSKQKLNAELLDSVLYHNPEDKSGLIAVNKPYGLPNYSAKDTPYSLSSSLQDLADQLQIEKLEIVKTVDRYCSGITLLSHKPETKDKLKKVQKRMKCERKLADSYLTLVTGHADINCADNFRIKLKEFPNVQNPLFSKVHKEPVILSGVSTRLKRLKQGETSRHVSTRTISRSSLVPLSLVEISPSSLKNHLIRVWLAERGHPVLGDELYDYRVRTVLDQKIIRGPEHSQAQRTQILPSPTLHLFELSKGEVWRLPTFLHHWRTILPGWAGKGKDLTIFAPPPKHFLQTLREAKIKFDFENFIQTDSIATYASETKKKTPTVEVLED